MIWCFSLFQAYSFPWKILLRELKVSHFGDFTSVTPVIFPFFNLSGLCSVIMGVRFENAWSQKGRSSSCIWLHSISFLLHPTHQLISSRRHQISPRPPPCTEDPSTPSTTWPTKSPWPTRPCWSLCPTLRSRCTTHRAWSLRRTTWPASSPPSCLQSCRTACWTAMTAPWAAAHRPRRCSVRETLRVLR